MGITVDEDAQRHMMHPMYQLRLAFLKEAATFSEHQKRREIVEHEMTKLGGTNVKTKHERFFDVIPGFVIMLNALVLGVSADYHPSHMVWEYIEICFTMFFTAEIVVKSKYYG